MTVEKDGQVLEHATVTDPLDTVRAFKARYTVPEIDGLPRFTGGLVGYFGYETVRYIEPRLGNMTKPDVVGAPDILLTVSDEVVVFDNLQGQALRRHPRQSGNRRMPLTRPIAGSMNW